MSGKFTYVFLTVLHFAIMISPKYRSFIRYISIISDIHSRKSELKLLSSKNIGLLPGPIGVSRGCSDLKGSECNP